MEGDTDWVEGLAQTLCHNLKLCPALMYHSIKEYFAKRGFETFSALTANSTTKSRKLIHLTTRARVDFYVTGCSSRSILLDTPICRNETAQKVSLRGQVPGRMSGRISGVTHKSFRAQDDLGFGMDVHDQRGGDPNCGNLWCAPDTQIIKLWKLNRHECPKFPGKSRWVLLVEERRCGPKRRLWAWHPCEHLGVIGWEALVRPSNPWKHRHLVRGGTSAERNCPRTKKLIGTKKDLKNTKKDPKNDPKLVRKLFSPSHAA